MTKPKKRTGSIKYPLEGDNPAIGLVPESFWQKIQVEHNRVTGKSYEKIAAAVVLSTLSEEMDISKLTISIDKQWFHCFSDNSAKRRYDIYIKELEFAYEVKSYRVLHTRFIREQIKKDRWLIEHGKVKEVRWLLFNGGSSRMLDALTQNRIIYLDTTGDETNFTNIPRIYQTIPES